MILIIHTADQSQVLLALAKASKLIAQKRFKAQYQQGEKLLLAIDDLLQAKNYKLKAIKGIAVISGPGPFTALRIGVATANTLAWALGVPIIGIKLNEFQDLDQLAAVAEKKIKKASAGKIIEPFYDKEPNITKRRLS